MLERATEEQRAIITAPIDRHMKVVAVAGSGKTTTMCGRVAYMAEQGVDMRRVLVMMFNKSAQLDFVAKLTRELGEDAELPQVRTYNSLGNRLCSTFSKAGLLPQKRLVDKDVWAASIARRVLLTLIPDPTSSPCNPYRPDVVDDFLGFCDFVKSGLSTPLECFQRMGWKESYGVFLQGYDALQAEMESEGLRFFSDQIYEPVQLMTKNPEAEAMITNRLSHVFVDEYQDINEISELLLRYLAGTRAKVQAIGDDDQTLYEFRGAEPKLLVSVFDKHFPGAETYTLSRTFRYGHAISLAANNVITRNRNRISKLCISDSSTPKSEISLWQEDRKAKAPPEKSPTVKAVREYVEAGGDIGDIAVLVRTFSAAAPIELAFMLTKQSYTIEGGGSVLAHPAIQGLITTLRLANKSLWECDKNTKTQLIDRFLAFPHCGLPGSFQRDIAVRASQNGPTGFRDGVMNANELVHEFTAVQLAERLKIFDALMETTVTDPFKIITYYLQKTDCFNRVKSQSGRPSDARETIALVEAFHNFVGHHGGDITALLATVDRITADESPEDGESVTITTVHRSKGREWPLVILPGLSQGGFPYIRDDVAVDIESERRLFYVAITRAQKRLLLIVPPDRDLLGSISKCLGRTTTQLPTNRTAASMFVYEANLKACSATAKAISGDRAPFNELPRVGHGAVLNKYLETITSGLAVKVA